MNKDINNNQYIGCAIFGRADKFKILSSKRVHLRDYGGAALSLSRSHNFHKEFTGKFNPMAITMLQMIETNQTVCVANTHLYWNPARAGIYI
jgi:mRNA deadenylase 3'-5' endonuclease subunit Ccr4